MDNGLYSYKLRLRRKRRRKRLIKILFIVATVIFFYFVINTFLFQKKTVFVSPFFLPGSSVKSTTQVASPSLKEVVEKALEGSEGTYGVVIKNLETKEEYFSNEQRVFEAGSLYKLWVMVAVYNKIEKGELKEDQILTQSIAVLNRKFEIDPKLAEQTQGRISLSVADALRQMITISHNYAALLLTEKVKLSSVALFLKEQNFNQSKVGTEGDAPTTTPSDIALFFEKLYKGELASQEHTDKMLSHLKGQQLNDKIPKYLPNEANVAHKTGELGWFTHDAGIVYSPKGNYIIVVFSESEFPKGAEERIAEISKAVYTYFEQD